MYTKIYLRLEPLGLELVAAAVRQAGHQVQLIDLQAETHKDYVRLIDHWQPDVVAFSCNYLANVPEIVDLAKLTRVKRPETFVLVGGHSASFIAQELLEHAGGAIDCVVKGEGEASVLPLLEAVEHDRRAVAKVAGVVTLGGEGPPARLVENLDELLPARDLLRHRRRYFLGTLYPCAPRNPQAVLSGNPRRRAAAQSGCLQVLDPPGAALHVPGARSHRRGGAAQVPQADLPRPRLRSPRVRALARHHGRDQPDRRSRLGPRAVRSDPPVVPGDPRDREHLGQHALSGHGDVAHGGAPGPHAGLPPLRHPARGPADAVAAGGVLRRADPYPARSRDEASRVERAPRSGDDRTRPAGARTDELRPEPLEVQSSVRSGAHARRPPPSRHLRDEAAASATGDGRSTGTVYLEPARPFRPLHRRRHRAVRRDHPDGNE